jgi:hypothetical protein
MDESRWYARIRNIPGVRYEPSIAVDPASLPKHNVKPKVYTFDFDGEKRKSLSWETPDGSTSQSPASEWMSVEGRKETPETVIQRVYEALELPGTAFDYHFALLHAYDDLAGRARRAPALLAEVERLCLLDVMLLEAVPDVVLNFGGRDLPPLRAPSFARLIDLYERNGFLDDALAIARRGEPLGQCVGEVERLTEEIALLRAEDAS